MPIPAIGVCYYPEHWPVEWWEEDARRMAEVGIQYVRIGEFAWSRLEPTPGELTFDWLVQSMDTLGRHGLKVIVGTPTATPPRWMIDKHPDMLAVDKQGRPRGFGSRRHYDFSHQGYREECARITRLLIEKVGHHPALAGWQTDNEYGCHDTVLSYSEAARQGFRRWLAERYGTVEALNEAWGGVFWSMDYNRFDQVDLPNLTVTAAAESGPKAFRMAGLKPADVNMLSLYDAFTITPILFLEDLGYCPKGEGGRFVANGAIAPGGKLPVNTSGGGLSYCHPGMYGLLVMIEAVRQVRGECGERQMTTRGERTRAAGLKCRACGSRWLTPSIEGRGRLAGAEGARQALEAEQRRKQGAV